MKISAKTLEILKNFAEINKSIIVNAGKRLSTITPAKHVVSYVDTEESFPDFAMWDLPNFLSVLGLFDKSTLDVDFQDNCVVVTDGSTMSSKYYYTNRDIISEPPKTINFPQGVIDIDLTKSALDSIFKASAALSLNTAVFVNKDGKMTLSLVNSENNGGNQSAQNSFDINLGDTGYAETLVVPVAVANMRFVSGNYTMTITDKNIVKFLNSSGCDLEYFVGVEPNFNKDNFGK